MKIFNTIQSRERSTTIYLMNLFDLVSHNELTPDLKELLGIKRDEIMAQGMDALLDVGGTGFFPGIEEAVDDPDIRREIDLIFLLPAYQEIMAKRLGEIVASASERGPDRGGQDHRPDGPERAHARGPRAAPPGPVRRGRPLRPRERRRPPPPRARPARSWPSWPIP